MLCDNLQGLAGEKRRLQSGVAQLERELVGREGQLLGQAGELAALQEAQRDAHAQMNQYVMDLQVIVIYNVLFCTLLFVIICSLLYSDTNRYSHFQSVSCNVYQMNNLSWQFTAIPAIPMVVAVKPVRLEMQIGLSTFSNNIQ